MNKILITGATGHLGAEVIELLAEQSAESTIAALVRNPDKAEPLKAKGVEIREGDYDDYDSLLRAFKGIDKLYFVSGSDIANRTRQHENVVNAAKEARVPHVVYTSFMRKNETASSPIAPVAEAHLKTEAWLKSSGLAYTILKHTLYLDMLPVFMGEQVIENGLIYQPAGDGKAAMLTRHDMAEVAVAILTSEGHENKEYDITAGRAYSYGDIAAILSELAGKPIQYVSPSQEAFSKTLSEQGVPAEAIGMSVGFAEAIKQGEFGKTSHDTETILGHQPTSLPDYLKQVYGS